MSKSRRRTLSSLEVASFLNEIGSSKNEMASNANIIKSENDGISKSVDQLKPVSVAPPDDAQRIRDYCRIKCSGKVHDIFQWEAMRNVSRAVHEKTTYKLMSERLMLPERFFHPIGSIENRREILLGLSGMLTEADAQRKQDVDACEKFTQCKSSKGRGKNTYEYVDILSQRTIDFDEYEKRYTQYINEAKYNRQQNYALQTQTTLVTFSKHQPMEIMEDKENIIPNTGLGSGVKVQKKRKHANSNSSILQSSTDDDSVNVSESSTQRVGGHRRETLSPGTVRKLLIEKVEVVLSPPPPKPAPIVESDHQEFTDIPLLPFSFSMPPIELPPPAFEASDSFPLEVMDDMIAFDDDLDDMSSSNHRRKRLDRGDSSQCRRSTLSPSAARFIAMEILQEETILNPQHQGMNAEGSIGPGKLNEPNVNSPRDLLLVVDTENISCEQNVEPALDVLATRMDTSSPENFDTSPCFTSSDQYSVENVQKSPIQQNIVDDDVHPSTLLSSAGENPSNLVHELDLALIDVMDEEEVAKRLESPMELESSSGSPTPVFQENSFNSISEDTVAIESYDAEVNLCPDETLEQLFGDAPSEIGADDDSIHYAAVLSDLNVENAIMGSPVTNFFGRRSEGGIINRGLAILDDNESDLEAFERLESFVSEVVSGKDIRETATSEKSSSLGQLSTSTSFLTKFCSQVEHFNQRTRDGTIEADVLVPELEEHDDELSRRESESTCGGLLPEGALETPILPSNGVAEECEASLHDIPEEIDESEWEKRASQVMRERFAVARCRYMWEIVSVHAANEAIRQMRKKAGTTST